MLIIHTLWSDVPFHGTVVPGIGITDDATKFGTKPDVV